MSNTENKDNQSSDADKFIKNYSIFWDDVPVSLLKEYKFQPKLTDELDEINESDLNTELLYKMVLWKLNRFPDFSNKIVENLKQVSALAPKNHRDAKLVLIELLRTPGVALPMASTLLRFMNPNTFQIIDDRVYRILFGIKGKYRPKPAKITEGWLDQTISIYFEYLDQLHLISSTKLPFHMMDRILYQLDKKIGNKISK